MIAKYGRFICRDGSEEDSAVLFQTLQGIVTDTSESITENNFNTLRKFIGFYDSLICYDGDNVVGACLYRYTSTHVEVLHLYVVPEYRVTYGCGLINHYLINVVAKGKDILLSSTDTGTFNKVINETKTPNVYKINERARAGLKKMFQDKVQWSE